MKQRITTETGYRYDGSFPLRLLAHDERVRSAGDGTGAAEIVRTDGSVQRVEVGEVVFPRNGRA